MMNKALQITAITFLGLIVASCASPGKPKLTLNEQLEKRDYTIIGPVERIQNYRLMGWNSLDRSHLIILSAPSRAYLVSFKQPCYNLLSAENIGITNTAGTVTLFDSVLVNDRPTGYAERCWIENLQELKQTRDKSA